MIIVQPFISAHRNRNLIGPLVLVTFHKLCVFIQSDLDAGLHVTEVVGDVGGHGVQADADHGGEVRHGVQVDAGGCEGNVAGVGQHGLTEGPLVVLWSCKKLWSRREYRNIGGLLEAHRHVIK